MILSVQYLRALAAFLVVASHIFGHANVEPLHSMRHLGNVGVDLFFVISGFIIFLTARTKNDNVASFLRRRIVRVAPPYWAITLLSYTLLVCLPGLANKSETSVEHLVKSLLFIAAPHPSEPVQMWPVVVPGWTLNYEAFFYLIVAASLCLPAALRFGALLASLSALALVGLACDLKGLYGFYCNPLLLEFGAGVLLAKLYLDSGIAGWRAPLLLVLVSLAALLAFGVQEDPDGPTRFVVWGLPAIGMVSGLVFFEKNARMPYSGFLKLLGDASYSLYLTQFLSIPAFFLGAKLLFPSGGDPHLLHAVLGLCFVGAVGLCAFVLVEKPLVNACRNWLPGGRAATIADGPRGRPRQSRNARRAELRSGATR